MHKIMSLGAVALATALSAVCPTLASAQSMAAVDPAPNLPSAYLGQVATRSNLPNNFNAINKQSMSRTFHLARDNITCLQLVYPNFYTAAAASGTEKPTGASATITASIEYPAGALTQVKFGGAASGSIPSGGMLTSDVTCIPGGIPRNARFWQRAHFTNTAGIVWSGRGTSTAYGDRFNYGPSSIADQTMTTGEPTQLSAQLDYYPAAIIAYTRRPSVALHGDSKLFGIADLVGDPSGDCGEVERALGPVDAYINLGSPADRVNYAVQAGNYANRTILTGYTSHSIIQYGYNDINGGRTAAQLEADLQQFVGNVLPANRPIWLTTITPSTSSRNNWTDAGGQAPMTAHAALVTYNTDVRLGEAAPVSGYFEVADGFETARDSGILKTNGTANFFTSDGAHENTRGAHLLTNVPGGVNPGLIVR